jgi:hypothetical protein
MDSHNPILIGGFLIKHFVDQHVTDLFPPQSWLSAFSNEERLSESEQEINLIIAKIKSLPKKQNQKDLQLAQEYLEEIPKLREKIDTAMSEAQENSRKIALFLQQRTISHESFDEIMEVTRRQSELKSETFGLPNTVFALHQKISHLGYKFEIGYDYYSVIHSIIGDEDPK